MPHVPRTGHTRSSHRRTARSTHDYDAAFNGIVQSANEVAQQESKDRIVSSYEIPARIITAGKLVETLSPPEVVETKPELPHVDYPVGSLIVYLSDGKLWRNVADVWTVAVETSDLSGTIIGTQIEDGEITTEKIRAGAITADRIDTGAVTADKIFAGSVTAAALASEILLASHIKTAASGRRLELDTGGVRIYDADGFLLVVLPTDGTPNYFSGEVNASILTAEDQTSISGTASLAGDAVMTLQTGVSAPGTAPSLSAGVDYLTLASTPGSVASAAGIAYDSGGDSSNGSFWIACNPTASPYYVAQEFAATSATGTAGRLLRSIPATGSSTTATDVAGSTAHVADRANGYTGDTDSAFGINIALPSNRGTLTITKVSCWLAGREGTASVKNALWNSSGTFLSDSAAYTAVDKGATGVGDSVLYTKDLSPAVAVAAGTTIRAGYFRTGDSDGTQHDVNTGSYTTYIGDGNGGDMTGVRTVTTEKPNFYVTYTYVIDTRLETAPNIGIATDGTYIYTLDTNGVVWKYLRSDMTYVTKSAVLSLTGVKANNGMFYDATAAKLIITHASGTTGTDHVKFSVVDPTTLTIDSTATDAVMFAVNGNTMTFRGGARLADPLNSNTVMYWVAMGAGGTWPFKQSDGQAPTNYADRYFGEPYNVSGVCHDGTVFRGWSTATPTKVWRFSGWDWTTGGSTWWVGYAWYANTGGYVTQCGPTASVTVGRRMQLQVTNGALPGGSADRVRVYMYQGASDAAAGSRWLQSTDAVTARFITSYATATHDSTTNTFSAGSPAELKSSATGWTLKGSGLINRTGTAFPSAPATDDHFWRSDLDMEFFYNGTRWLSTQLLSYSMPPYGTTAATDLTASVNNVFRVTAPSILGGSDAWIERFHFGYQLAAGTGPNSTNKWTVTFLGYPGGSTLGTIVIDDGIESDWTWKDWSTGGLLGSTVQSLINVNFAKTGTPGNLAVEPPIIYYRIVAT